MIKEASPRFKFDHEINVALFTRLASRHETKDSHMARTMSFGDRDDFGASARYVQDKRISGSFAYAHSFGRKVNDVRLVSAVSGALSVARLSSAFGTVATREGGTTARLDFGYGFDNTESGLTIFFDYLGAQPGVLSIDVGLPLNRRAADVGRYPTVSIMFTYNGSFFGGG